MRFLNSNWTEVRKKVTRVQHIRYLEVPFYKLIQQKHKHDFM